ncbi:MAG TPA: family 43 glycosylhydrolase [Candidatus Lokiarchaeia archaeon]|nr:family 43 glycosylhydrolase [Candidatus Lokiarchaeia archaeon]
MAKKGGSGKRASETGPSWVKFSGNPVLGGDLGTIFDVSVLLEQDVYRMWMSWRPQRSIAFVVSSDGEHWSAPAISLAPNQTTNWEVEVNRPCVVHHGDLYHMWYTGQAKGRSSIGYATSPDGVSWTRASSEPVFVPLNKWEKGALMCPHVLWDEHMQVYRMWYSGGEQYEPNAIGYATSEDGIHWNRLNDPVFTPAKELAWERDRVAACQVIQHNGWHLMFYVGFANIHQARIGLARSRDGILGWERHPANPIIAPTSGQWDQDACYKPYAIYNGERWLLWYNGRRGKVEQIGVAFHDTEDLWGNDL